MSRRYRIIRRVAQECCCICACTRVYEYKRITLASLCMLAHMHSPTRGSKQTTSAYRHRHIAYNVYIIYVYVSTYACTCACIYICVYARMCTSLLYVYVYKYVKLYMNYIYIYLCMHAFTYNCCRHMCISM